MISQEQTALSQKLQQELQRNEQVIWQAYPEGSRRAKQSLLRTLLPSWMVLRLFLLLSMFLVVVVTSIVYRSTTPLLLVLYGSIFLAVMLVAIILVVSPRRTARRRLQNTIYAITTRRLLVITLDRDQWVQNSYEAQDLGRIDYIERGDGWGDVVIGVQQRVQSQGYSLVVMSPRLSGVEHARSVAALLQHLKVEQRFSAP
jgi:hypothetical protein